METIGKCPVCGKGDLVKGTNGWTCNYFKTVKENCRFTIFNSYFGVEITPEIIQDLLDNGQTEVFDMFNEKKNTHFRASLKIMDEFVKLNFENSNTNESKILSVKCPTCGGDIKVTSKAYICENYFNDGNKCPVYIPNTVAGVELDEELAETILSGETTEWIDNFQSQSGNFGGRLVLDENINVKIDTSICKCPACRTGNIFQSKKAYNCSNWKEEKVKCTFTIWREIMSKDITPEMVESLCLNRETDVMSGFKNKAQEPQKRKLILTEDNQVKAI